MDKIIDRRAIDLSPCTVNSPRNGLMISAIRFTSCKLGYLPSDLIGAGKFSFEQRPPTFLDPALEPFEILDVVAQSLPDRFSVHQADVPPKLGTTRGNPSKILESSRAIGF